MFVIIKYGAMMICGYYVYLKLLHITVRMMALLKYLVLLLFFLPIMYLLRRYAEPFSVFVMVALFAFFVGKLQKVDLPLSMTDSVISFGIVYLAFLCASAFVCACGCIINYNGFKLDLLSYIFIAVLQFILITIPFKFKRLKKGMPFLMERGGSNIGVYISISLLIAASFFGISNNPDLIDIIPVVFILICGLIVIFWWRNSLTKKYMEKVKEHDIEILKKTIQKKDEEIEQLKYHNNELSKVIHKDNKLIPVMEHAVKQIVISAEQDTDKKVCLYKAHELISQLEQLSKERHGIVKCYEMGCRILPTTNILSLDNLLTYMACKAAEHHIDFELSLSGSMKYLVENIINESDITTLLADLIDNAIIATKKQKKRKIFICVSITANYYSIDVFDSGELFACETLVNLGMKRITTHTSEGGNGIGMMTTFEIVNKYHASFIIEDFLKNNLYTKKVSVCFDNKNQYRIKTNRDKEIKSLTNRTDIVLINNLASI